MAFEYLEEFFYEYDEHCQNFTNTVARSDNHDYICKMFNYSENVRRSDKIFSTGVRLTEIVKIFKQPIIHYMKKL